ncbi:MAG: DNRLRE domain-containing protein [Candidatus Coatesbacteria bacterium]|nr:DNRLRE domain-containing protein [Candidatus Coatesbacteria bacterium]
MKAHLAFISLCLLVLGAFAATEVLQPGPGDAKDVFIWGKYPDNNNEGNYLFSGYDGGFVLDLIQFDGLDDAMFDGANINSATLALYPRSSSSWGGAPPIDVVFRMITETWDPATVTWNTMPGMDFTDEFYFNITQDTTWVEVDLTDFVVEWVENGAPNYGFIFGPPSDPGLMGVCYYNGEETDNPSYRPKLTVDYSGASVVETSWGSIKALD